MWKIIEIRSSEYMPEIVQMTAEHYGRDNDISKPSYLEHEYFSNPSGNAIIYIAYDENEHIAAGQVAAIPLIVKNGRGHCKCLLVVNTLTRKAYRAQGVFKALASKVFEKASEDKYAIAYSMPNQYSYPGFLKHHGFSDIGRIPLYVRPIVPSRLVKSFLHSDLLSSMARIFDAFYRLKDAPKCTLTDFKAGIDKYSAEFWNAVNGKADVMVVRSSEYLKWRYVDIPFREYRGYYSLHDGVPVAVAVGRNMKVAGINCAMIADFIFAEGYEAYAKSALNQLLKDLKEQGAELAGCMVPRGSAERKVLREMKFFKCPRVLEPQPFRLIRRQFDLSDDSCSVSADLNKWFFTLGDYDVV